MTCILWSRWGNKPENKVWWNRTKHPKRWDSMPRCYFSLPTIFLILQYDISLVFYSHWDDRIYVAHAMFGSLIYSLHDYYFYVIDTWAIFTTYSYISRWHLHHVAVEFTFMFHKVLVEILIYMHGSRYVVIIVMVCVRGVPPRTRMIFIDDLCEGSPPKITYGTYWWWLQCEKGIYACFMSNS